MNNEPVKGDLKTESGFDWVFDGNNWLKIMNNEPVALTQADILGILTDEEMAIIKEAVGNYVCTIKMEIDQEKQTFKGYEHCSNLPSLRSELRDAEQALAILRKAQEK